VNGLQLYDMAVRQIADWHRQADRDRLAMLAAAARSRRQPASQRIRRGIALALAGVVAIVSQAR
jgi:hypothetical protein